MIRRGYSKEIIMETKVRCPINTVFFISDICARHCDDYPKGGCPIQVIEKIIKERKASGKST